MSPLTLEPEELREIAEHEARQHDHDDHREQEDQVSALLTPAGLGIGVRPAGDVRRGKPAGASLDATGRVVGVRVGRQALGPPPSRLRPLRRPMSSRGAPLLPADGAAARLDLVGLGLVPEASVDGAHGALSMSLRPSSASRPLSSAQAIVARLSALARPRPRQARATPVIPCHATLGRPGTSIRLA